MLALSQVSHVYPNGTVALNEVSLSIPKGIYGLLGPNGAGKSTLMRIIATLQAPTAGSVRFGDVDVLAQPDPARRTLGYLPQEFGVYPRVSAQHMLDHIAVLKGVSTRGERREIVEALLRQVNLWEVRHRTLARFSGGMKQRFGIAQALIGPPELLIVDEPTAGLDPEERGRFLDLLAGLGETAVVILSTHIVDDVSDLCQRVAVLGGGRILLEGEPADLVAGLSGRIWRKGVDRTDVEQCRARHELISTRLVHGRTIVHVLSDGDPGDGFEPFSGGLEDVYFAALSRARRPR
jgi:ABC-type multidrug transport system ATPase subunit